MKKITALIIVLFIVLSAIMISGCEKQEEPNDEKYQLYNFDSFCKYNLDLIEDVTLKNIAVPLVSNNLSNKDGQFEFKKITGENIDGIDVIFEKQGISWGYGYINVAVMIFQIETNDNYSSEQETTVINEFVFELVQEEYIVPVDITLNIKESNEVANKSILELDSIYKNHRIEIQSFEQDLNQNYVIKGIVSNNDIFDITLEKCKQDILEVNQGIEKRYKYAYTFEEIEKAYINDYDYFELIVNNKPTVFCGGDMIYFEVEDEITKQKENVLWGAVTYVDKTIISNLLSNI